MTHLFKTYFHQNPNVGLCGFANDKFALLPYIASQKQEEEIANVLQVPVHKVNVCGTSLLGVFIAGNNNGILLPHIIFESEKKHIDNWKIPHTILQTDHTALGNNIVATDDAALIGPDIEPVKNDIRKALKVSKIAVFAVQNIPVVGAMMVLNGKGCLMSAIASSEEVDYVQKFFKVPVTKGTVNMGSPYVRAGIMTNSKGFIFGDRTGGPEAVNIDSALGFLR